MIPPSTNGAAVTGEDILRTKGLTKRFGAYTAVGDVSFTVQAGEFHSIIGPNGAGKTTFFNLLSGLTSPDAGSIVFEGEDITHLPVHERVKRGLARSFQITSVFDHLTVAENVRLAAQSRPYADYDLRTTLGTPIKHFEEMNDLVEDILARVELDERTDAAAVELAYGQKRALEIGMVVALDPILVLLDEPTAGMAADDTNAMMELIEDVFADRTLVVIEHDIDLVMARSDTVTVLQQGQVLMEGTPNEISESEAVQEAYFGGRK